MKIFTLSGKIISLSVVATFFLIGIAIFSIYQSNEQIKTLHSIDNDMETIDNLRKIQVIFREVEGRMTSVISEMNPGLASAIHIKKVAGETKEIWEKTKQNLPQTPEYNSADEALQKFQQFSVDLEDIYRNKYPQDVVQMYEERWVFLKPKILKYIDKVVEEKNAEFDTFIQKEQESNKNKNTFLIAGSSFIALFLVVFSFFMVRSIISKVKKLDSDIQILIERKNLTVTLIEGTDELGSISKSVNHLISYFRNAMVTMKQSADKLSISATDVAKVADHINIASQHQSEQASATAAAVEELTVSIGHVSDNATHALNDVSASQESAKIGSKLVNDTIMAVEKVSETFSDVATSIKKLQMQSEQIGVVVKTIRDIADQTNLLALNAAIEAARAGEQGRGFAVVADEVRKLAERTTHEATQISSTVSIIQENITATTDKMDASLSIVSKGSDLASKTGESLLEIEKGSESVKNEVTDIGNSLREQANAATLVAQSMQKISSVTEETTIVTSEAAKSAMQLKEISRQLDQFVGDFTIW